MSGKSGIIVDNFIVKVILFRITPGKEYQVEKHFRSFFKGIDYTNFRFYRLIGEFDLALIYHRDNIKFDLMNAGTVKYILDSRELICIPYYVLDGKKSERIPFSLEKLDALVLGIMMIKIEPALLFREGIAWERRLSNYVSSKKKDTRIYHFGSMGWNESVVMATGDNFEEVFTILRNISKLVGTYKSQNKIEKIRFVHKTYSLMGIESTKYINNKKLLRDDFPLIFDYDEKSLFPVVKVSCNKDSLAIIKKIGQRYFRVEPEVRSGKYDLIFRVIKGNWGDFLINLGNFRKRKDLSNSMYSTAVDLSLLSVGIGKISKISESKSDVTAPQYSTKLITLNKSIINKMKVILPEPLLDTLIHSIYVLNSRLQDPIVRDAYESLGRYAQYILTYLFSKDAAKKKDTIEEMHDLLMHGSRERSQGLFGSLLLEESQFSVQKPAIQRILTSTEYIPDRLLSFIDTKFKWEGFNVAGRQRGFSHTFGVFNIPTDSLLKPDKWMSIVHEVGHHIILYYSVIDFQSNSIQNILNVIKDEWPNLEARDKIGNILYEVAAEVFCLKFGYMDDINLFFSQSGKFLYGYFEEKQNDEKMLMMLSRLFLIYMYHNLSRKGVIGKSALERWDNDRLLSKIENFSNFMLKHVTHDISCEKIILDNKDHFQRIYQYVYPFLEIINKNFSIYDEKIKEMLIASKSVKYNRYKNMIKNGMIIEDKITFPTVLLYKILKANFNMDSKSRLALILSFWHSNITSNR